MSPPFDRHVGPPDLPGDLARDRAKAFLASIVESSDDAIIGKDLDGVILSWNRGAQRLYGYTPEEMLGRSVAVLMPPHRADDFPEIMTRIRAGKRVEHYETERMGKDGSIRQISLTVSPITDDDGRIVGASAIARDITEHKAFEEHQARLVKELRAANRARQDFLASMSHELRTPLNAIMGYAELLRKGLPVAIPEGADAQVARIETSARHLLRLIEEVLLFSRIEGQGVELEIRDTELEPLLDEVKAMVQPMIREKGLAFAFEEAGAPDRVRTDPTRLQQVLLNLLGNAVKFTEEGHVTLAVAREGEDVVFRVRDTGVGIEEEDRDHLFEPFWQGAPPRSGDTKGTGLGLTIASRIVDGLGGQITVDGGRASGACFVVRLPLDGGPLAGRAGDPQDDPGPDEPDAVDPGATGSASS